MNPTILKAKFVDERGNLVGVTERKSFGDFTVEEKVKQFRRDCKRAFPDLVIESITFCEIG